MQRPGTGISPIYIKNNGKKVKQNLDEDCVLIWKHIGNMKKIGIIIQARVGSKD